MAEGYCLGVQIQAVGRVAVEAVAYYRCAKSEPVCAVNAQLVGASGVRKQLYQRASCCLSDNLIVGYGSLSVVCVHLLIRAVKRVGDEWQTYSAAFSALGVPSSSAT